jgi:hypothetical protein
MASIQRWSTPFALFFRWCEPIGARIPFYVIEGREFFLTTFRPQKTLRLVTRDKSAER